MSYSFARRRINLELKNFEKEPPKYGSAGPVGEDVFEWNATVIGPRDSPYECGFFFLKISFPIEYPLKPPKISFDTKVYHHNVLNGKFWNLRMLRGFNHKS